ncbi:LytR C-terminal domain-containing protein [Microbacterium kyungheense]|uniref:LytR cell envelope-related transcriptional attenuator n=1 Tax=Microbacterium kyungheense TaxID=1263636 RepID=A0A543F0Y7_9MICO|nr:LytR C-terminal domain-containing protein [Microbacterium kyungheense]TQM27491.1 LytR cell envelope-related transcriptional attenuator [Microbacterium kyungheense]
MPTSRYPQDRFDDLPDTERVGAHRAENPRMRGWVVLLWAALATVVLIAVGIFGTLIASGRIELAPTPTPTATPVPEVSPVKDTTYEVMILNATPEQGLATQLKDVVVQAGWAEDAVTAGEAGSQDFPTTTVFYSVPEDEAAAKGLAEAIGGAATEQSDAYPASSPDVKQLTIVVGLDRTAAGQSPAPTP